RNVDLGGRLTSAPAGIQRAGVDGQPCTRPGNSNDPALTNQLVCATRFATCPVRPALARYPKQTRIVMVPLPRLASMPRPCAGVPRNALCPCPPAGRSPGADGWTVAVDDSGLVLVPRRRGAIRVQDHGPAPLVDDDLVVKEAEQGAVGDAGGAAVL